MGNSVDVICMDATKNISALKPVFDTVIMNPPFGTKNNAGNCFVYTLNILFYYDIFIIKGQYDGPFNAMPLLVIVKLYTECNLISICKKKKTT